MAMQLGKVRVVLRQNRVNGFMGDFKKYTDFMKNLSDDSGFSTMGDGHELSRDDTIAFLKYVLTLPVERIHKINKYWTVNGYRSHIY